MRFKSVENISCPCDEVFSQLTNVEYFERLAIQNNATVEKVDGPSQIGVGSTWFVSFNYRARTRRMKFVITKFDPGKTIKADFSFQSRMTGFLLFEMIPVAPDRTRLIMQLEINPETLSARLLIQSIKLARKTFDKRYANWTSSLAKRISARAIGN